MVPDKRSATFIDLRKIFQGLRSYLEGVRLLVLTKCFLQARKVGFKIPNSMKIIYFKARGYDYLRGNACYFCQIFQGGMFILGATLIRNSKVFSSKKPIKAKKYQFISMKRFFKFYFDIYDFLNWTGESEYFYYGEISV